MNLTTCTHGAHKIHSCKNKGVHTAKPFRVYRRGPWPRVQTRPLPLRPCPEPSACTCDPGPEPSACTCDPRKRVHSRPPDPLKLSWQWNITMFIVGDTSSDGWFFHCHVFLNSHYISQRKGGMCFEFGLWTFLLYNWVQLEDDQLRMFRSSSHLCFLSGLLLSRFWSLGVCLIGLSMILPT